MAIIRGYGKSTSKHLLYIVLANEKARRPEREGGEGVLWGTSSTRGSTHLFSATRPRQSHSITRSPRRSRPHCANLPDLSPATR